MAKSDPTKDEKKAQEAARAALGVPAGEKAPEGASEEAGAQEAPQEAPAKSAVKNLSEQELNDALMNRSDSGMSNSIAEASAAERKSEIGNLAELIDGRIVGLVQKDGSGMLGLKVQTFLNETVTVWFASAPFDETPGFAAVEA